MIGRVLCAMFLGVTVIAGAQTKGTEDARVVLVMTDGMRWQEVFRGADESLLTPERYFEKRDVSALREKYLAATPEERRQKLMPFLWSTFIPQGQIYGDRDAQFGPFLQVTWKKLTIGAYWFNPGSSEQVLVGSVGVAF